MNGFHFAPTGVQFSQTCWFLSEWFGVPDGCCPPGGAAVGAFTTGASWVGKQQQRLPYVDVVVSCNNNNNHCCCFIMLHDRTDMAINRNHHGDGDNNKVAIPYVNHKTAAIKAKAAQ